MQRKGDNCNAKSNSVALLENVSTSVCNAISGVHNGFVMNTRFFCLDAGFVGFVSAVFILNSTNLDTYEIFGIENKKKCLKLWCILNNFP